MRSTRFEFRDYNRGSASCIRRPAALELNRLWNYLDKDVLEHHLTWCEEHPDGTMLDKVYSW